MERRRSLATHLRNRLDVIMTSGMIVIVLGISLRNKALCCYVGPAIILAPALYILTAMIHNR